MANLILGTPRNDRLQGEDSSSTQITNVIYGYAGGDSISGGTYADNTVYAGAGNDKVYGGDRSDRLFGEDGDDYIGAGTSDDARLYGGAGNDTLVGSFQSGAVLDGGTGADLMRGWENADTYVIDNLGDVIEENTLGLANGPRGADRVVSSISYTLATNLEEVQLVGRKNLAATGNDAANAVEGNRGANLLDGRGGRDTIGGGDGADTLNGGYGSDVLTGGSGTDTFLFDSRLNASANVDILTDFVGTGDTIALSARTFRQADGVGTEGLGALTPGQFALKSATGMQAADDRIIFDRRTGELFYDPDGGSLANAVEFATIAEPRTAGLAFDDFVVVA